MNLLPCNLCGADDYDVLFRAGVAQSCQIVKCRHCGLMYANPRAHGAEIEEIVDWDPDFVYRKVTERESYRVDKQTLQCKDYDSTRRFLAEWHPARGRLVEVGSSLGYLLDYFRQDGWDVVGVEPNRGYALYAQRKFGLNMIATTLGESGIEPASVDAVTMMHVIEHVPDPRAEFREVHRVLKPGGTFVLETPRYDTMMFRLLGKRERSLRCDGHIYFFTSTTLAEMGRQCGFEVLRMSFVGRSLTLDRLLYNVGVVLKSEAVHNALRQISKVIRLDKVALHLSLRDMERIYLRKV